MTLSEFRAWLEGFEEAIDGAPTPKQWEKIRKRLASVEAGAAPTIIERHYHRQYRPWWDGSGWHVYCEAYPTSAITAASATSVAAVDMCDTSEAAYRLIGKREALST